MLAGIITPRKKLSSERQLFTNQALKVMIIPLIIEQVLQMAVGLADTMMVSYAGEAVVAGVGLDTMVYTIFIYLFTAVSAGGAVVVSQYIGSKDKKNADLAGAQIFYIAGILAVACMVLMLVWGNGLLERMYPSAETATIEACKTYMRIVAFSFPANAFYNAGAAVQRSMGRTQATMWISLTANLINVAGNAIGIFVLHAGAAGVAWPTTISWYAAAAIMTALCLKNSSGVQIHFRKMLCPDWYIDKKILSVAVPNAVENTLFQAAKVILGMLVATFGTVQIAANTTGQTFWSLAACMGIAMGTVFITVIGRCIGAGDSEAAEWYMSKLLRLSVVLATGWNIIVMLLTPLILPLYNLTAETKRLILILVAIHNLFSALVQPFSGPLSSGLRAAGDVKFTMWTSLFTTVVCRTFLSFLLAKWMGMGVIGIAIAMVLDWTIKAALDWWRLKGGTWKSKAII